MWARRTRILVVGAVLTVGLLATVLLQAPAPTQTVDELMASPADHLNQDIAVRGEVQDVDEEGEEFRALHALELG